MKYKDLVATAIFAIAAHASAGQPSNVQTLVGTNQVAITETEGDLIVVFCVTVPRSIGHPPIMDSTGQTYKDTGCPGHLVAYVARNAKGGYHLLKTFGVSKIVVSEYKGVTWAQASGCGHVNLPGTEGFHYTIWPNAWKGELLVSAQMVNTPDAWIAPANPDLYHTEVYDQKGAFVVKDMFITQDSGGQPLPELLLTQQENAQVTYAYVTLMQVPPSVTPAD